MMKKKNQSTSQQDGYDQDCKCYDVFYDIILLRVVVSSFLGPNK